MKTSRSRIITFLLLCVFVLVSSLAAWQSALGSYQRANWANQNYLPLVLDSLSLPTSTPTPTLTLTVSQSPLTIYPPIMIYTAQLNYVPSTTFAQLKVDFYNLAGNRVEYLGSAPVIQAGQAQLGKQMMPGIYTAVARLVIPSQVIWSNIVTYTVR